MTARNAGESAWVATAFVVQYAAQAGRAVFLARLLAPHDLGVYFVLRSLGVAGAVAAQLGLGQVGLRRISATDDPAVTASVLRGVLSLTATATAAIIPVILLVGWGFGLRGVDALLVGAMVAALTWTATLGELARGFGRTAAVSSIERVLGSVADLLGLAVLLLIIGTGTLTQILAVTVGASLIPLVLLARLVRLSVPADAGPDEKRRSTTRDLLGESWPVAGNALLWRALAEVDLWLVALLGTPAQAAVYGIALRLAIPLDLPKSVAAYRLAPHIAHAHASGQPSVLQQTLKRSARWTTVTTVAGYLTVFAMGSQGLEILFGEQYASAMPVFIVLGIGRIVSAASGLAGVTLLMTRHSRALMNISVRSTIVTAAGALLLIPNLGAIGAALAASGGFTIQCLLMVRAVARYSGVSVHAGPRFN
jgi:O-antigen/teichoic acid export membrane protein